jgi:hypothetical protein
MAGGRPRGSVAGSPDLGSLAPAHAPPGRRRPLQAEIVERLEFHSDRQVFVHLPKAGHGVRAARLLAEIGDVRARFPDEEALAALGRVAPVTRASGKTRSVGFRWACDKQLRDALIDFADDSRHASPWAAKVYADALARTRRHPHAVRILARARPPQICDSSTTTPTSAAATSRRYWEEVCRSSVAWISVAASAATSARAPPLLFRKSSTAVNRWALGPAPKTATAVP